MDGWLLETGILAVFPMVLGIVGVNMDNGLMIVIALLLMLVAASAIFVLSVR